ncbi:MAG: ATPase, T2SS/T4P/T4SS family [Opitutaceae bacterium]|nr:ATPase, T2SS/T4P/T4SS family [Opitutaceae bacterium]
MPARQPGNPTVLTADDYVLQLAVDHGLLRPEQLAAARRRETLNTSPGSGSAGPRAREILLAEGRLDQRALAQLLAAESGTTFVELGGIRVAGVTLGMVPRPLVSRHKIFPIEKTPEGALKVAVANPFDIETLDSLAHFAGCPIEPCVATEEDIAAAIDRFYGTEAANLDDVLAGCAETGDAGGIGPEGRTIEAGEEGEGDAPIIKLVHSLILDAIRRRASDIHLEPLARRLRLRYRIDGVLLEVENPPKRLQSAIVSRLKIMANISIAEKRIPQDGRIMIRLDGRSFDLRVSTLPTSQGESVVLRLLDREEGGRLGLTELGFLPEDQARVERLIAMPDGMMLVTGPTGSGKTTTLYACLHHLNHTDRKIITVEDPVEYQLPGINQVPVRADIGMTFAAALRAMLRQAPNIVMVGEIRDLETAEIAINASLTGHLVLSTLHTNDAPSAVTRLVDIGVKSFLVATSLRGVMAQRLVRLICPECKRPCPPGAIESRPLGSIPPLSPGASCARGQGCLSCLFTGYRGRAGLFEIFLVDAEIQQMIYAGAAASNLRECARRHGMRTMREDGISKVIAGLTTLEEVVSLTVGDSN